MAHTKPEYIKPNQVLSDKRKITRMQGIFTQCNSVMGVSIVTYPYTYAKLGYVLSSCFILFMCIISANTLYFLSKCARDTQLDNLDEIISRVSNKSIGFICTFILYMACLLPLIFYLKISIDFFSDILRHFGFSEHKVAVGILTSSFCFLLCIVYQKVEHLDVISMISLAALLAFTLYIFYDFSICFGYINFHDLKAFELNCDSLSSLSFIIFGFMSHNSIIPITSCLSDCDATEVIVISNFIAACIYVITGFLGFAVHPSSDPNYLLNSGGSCDFKIAIMFFLGAVNIFSFPLMMITAVKNMFRLFTFVDNFTETNILQTLGIFANILLSMFFVFGMRNMVVLESLFFIVGSLLMFMLPISLFLRIHAKIRYYEWIIIFVSVILTVFSVYMGIKGFKDLWFN